MPDGRPGRRIHCRHRWPLGMHVSKSTRTVPAEVDVGHVPGVIDEGEVVVTIAEMPPAIPVPDKGHRAEIVPRRTNAVGQVAVIADVEAEAPVEVIDGFYFSVGGN